MTGLTALYVMGGAVMVAALFLWAVIRGAEGAADAARQINAGKTPQQIKDDNDARW